MKRAFLMLPLLLLADSVPMVFYPGRGDICILWYNVENLFYPGNDTIPGDDEFTPEGVRHWTYYRYQKKITAIAKVVVAAGRWDPPDIVGLCEIEDASVLKDLVQHPILASYGYHFVHFNSPDHRGMDVACLYREKRIRLTGWEVFKSNSTQENRGTRDILHFWGAWGKSDSLDLFLVHLISKYSGVGATAEPRKRQVSDLVHWVDSVHEIRANSIKVLAGDFNEAMEGYSMEPIRMGFIGGDSIGRIYLEGRLGSYKYRGRWSQIDQFLVCGQSEEYLFSGYVLELPVLLSPDETYGGIKPRRTYVGYKYNGGISDHLPIILDISGHSFPGFSE